MRKRLLAMGLVIIFVASGMSLNNDAGTNTKNEEVVASITYRSNECYLSALQPVVVITQPDDGTIVTDPNLVVLGYATDESGMDYWEWTWEWAGGSYSNSSYFEEASYVEFRVNITGLHDGWNLIMVTFRNIYGLDGSDSVNVTYNPSDNEPPEVAIESPAEGQVFTESAIHVTGTATDNIGVTRISYIHEWEGGSMEDSWPIDPTTYYPFDIEITLHDGWNSIRVEASDDAENHGSDEVNVSYIPEENWPPDPPEDPSPGDGARLVDVKNVNLSWFCFDPDLDDDVYYKILFEADDSTPDEIVSWQNSSIYEIGELEPNTCYYWQVIADDGNGGVTAGPVWNFTTRDIDPPEAYFVTPKEGHLYLFGWDIGFIGRTIIIGPIDVEVHAEDDVGINSVEFYVDGTLKLLDFYSPYSFRLNNVVGKHSIKAVVTDGQFNILNISREDIVVFSYGINREPSIDLYAHTGDAKDPAGDDIPSIKNNGLKHFVSPVKGYKEGNDPDKVTIYASYDGGNIEPIPVFQWVVPSGVTTSGDYAYVPRNNLGKYVITGNMVANGNVKASDTIVVWIVKSEIKRDTSYDFKIEKINKPTGLILKGYIGFVHTIKPSTIFTDADRPDLTGKNDKQPPFISIKFDSVWNSGMTLDGGANRKWDVSRQVRTKSSFTDIPNWIKLWVESEKYGPKWKSYTRWPTDKIVYSEIVSGDKNAVGNDDKFVGSDENNDPYSNGGKLKSNDRPSRFLPHIKFNWGATAKVQLHLQFREFTRLEIAGRWYRISDYYNWRCNLKFKSTAFDGTYSKWVDDGSVIETNHNGW